MQAICPENDVPAGAQRQHTPDLLSPGQTLEANPSVLLLLLGVARPSPHPSPRPPRLLACLASMSFRYIGLDLRCLPAPPSSSSPPPSSSSSSLKKATSGLYSAGSLRLMRRRVSKIAASVSSGMSPSSWAGQGRANVRKGGEGWGCGHLGRAVGGRVGAAIGTYIHVTHCHHLPYLVLHL